MGLDFRLAAPDELRPTGNLVARCEEIARASGAELLLTTDVGAAASGADFVYTDVWLSMGLPEAAWRERIELLEPYRVDRKVLEMAANPAVKFMHCLPASHNRETRMGEEIFARFGLEEMEVTEDVFESDASIVFEQAENRVHTVKAVMVATLAD